MARLTPCGRSIRRPTSAVLVMLPATAEGCLIYLATMAATVASAKFCRLVLSADSGLGLGDMECSTKASTWCSIALANDICACSRQAVRYGQVIVVRKLGVDSSQGHQLIDHFDRGSLVSRALLLGAVDFRCGVTSRHRHPDRSSARSRNDPSASLTT